MACQKYKLLGLSFKNHSKIIDNFSQISVNNFNANNMPKPYIS